MTAGGVELGGMDVEGTAIGARALGTEEPGDEKKMPGNLQLNKSKTDITNKSIFEKDLN